MERMRNATHTLGRLSLSGSGFVQRLAPVSRLKASSIPQTVCVGVLAKWEVANASRTCAAILSESARPRTRFFSSVRNDGEGYSSPPSKNLSSRRGIDDESNLESMLRQISSDDTTMTPMASSSIGNEALEGLGLTNTQIRRNRGSRGGTKRRRRRQRLGYSGVAPPHLPYYYYSGSPNAIVPERPFSDYDDEHGISTRVRVKSVHAAQTIDVVAVLSKVFGGGFGTVKAGHGFLSSCNRPVRHVFGKTSVIVQLPPPIPTEGTAADPGGTNMTKDGMVTTPLEGASRAGEHGYLHPAGTQFRYVAVFRYGSVVFFNVSPREAGKILEEIKKYGTDSISSGFERKEHFEVAIQPGMEETAHVNGDFATVKELDMNSVAIISTIMAQTVALDSYSDTVDELLHEFASINSTVKRTGNFTEMEKEKLFKVVAQNNSLFIDMISKLGIKDRSDTAWNLSQYERVHEGMKEEFELGDRFEHIEFKLNLIQQNAKFFLEVLHAQKTNSLEWIIIVLISFECVLMCLEMSGTGPTFFQALTFE